MEWTVAIVLYYFIIPALLFFFFCRLTQRAFKWYFYLLYAVAFFGLLLAESNLYISGYVCVILQIVLLAAFAVSACGFAPALCVAALVYSVYSIIAGITQSALHWLISSTPASAYVFMRYADILQHLLTAALLILAFYFILKLFDGSIVKTYRLTFLLVGLPVFFIALVEKTLASSIYGTTVVWDSEKGLVSPIVNNEELIALQIIAFAGLFCTLLAYKRLLSAFSQEQTLNQLQQQTQYQRIYLREAQARYAKTRSFRHDVKNHLLVLRQLLNEGKNQQAGEYLCNLEQVSASLFCEVNTGNAVADALLASKLAAAQQQQIAVENLLALPPASCVADIDWCVILSNAVDNAIAAAKELPPEERYLHISGAQKGNFFMLCVKNGCAQTALPTYGTGLNNIKSVAQRYGGSMETDISDGVFTLNVLLISQQ